jgi:large subunit ribosomal protein L5
MRLKDKYKKEVIPQMMEKFGYKNPMAVPKIEKVVINCGFGKMIVGKGSAEREKIQNHILNTLSLIVGQKPSLKKARKSISSFKLRKGMTIGAQITLRGKKMYEFLEKLIWLVLPRTRDFRGIPLSAFDQNGNLTIGFREYTPFPEVTPEKEKGIFGLEVTVVTTAKNGEEGIELLKLLGFPIKTT